MAFEGKKDKAYREKLREIRDLANEIQEHILNASVARENSIKIQQLVVDLLVEN